MNFYNVGNLAVAIYCIFKGIILWVTKPILAPFLGVPLTWEMLSIFFFVFYVLNISFMAKDLQDKDSFLREFTDYPEVPHDDFQGFVTNIQRDTCESHSIPSDLIERPKEWKQYETMKVVLKTRRFAENEAGFVDSVIDPEFELKSIKET